jgi:hypothetical protein
LTERGGAFQGTPTYASISAHECKNLSFRDDLESLAYSLLALFSKENGFWFKFDPKDHK